MKPDLEHAPIDERFEHLLELLSSPRFLNCEGLNGEVPFFICPYPPSEAVEMASMQMLLIARLQQKGVAILHLNLYDLTNEMLKREGDWDWIVQNESRVSKGIVKEELEGNLDCETKLKPEIVRRMNAAGKADVLILTGIGEVFPYIRSHNVLNNLQSVAGEKPLLMFFPGAYTHSLESGASLDLFSRLQDDKYYRAFNVFELEI